MISKPFSHRRSHLALALVATIALGLASRAFPLFPAFLGKYPGDALWALMVLFGIAFVRPDIPASYRAPCARRHVAGRVFPALSGAVDQFAPGQPVGTPDPGVHISLAGSSRLRSRHRRRPRSEYLAFLSQRPAKPALVAGIAVGAWSQAGGCVVQPIGRI